MSEPSAHGKPRDSGQEAQSQTGRGVRSGRTTSLARGIVWGYWWRRLFSYLLLNLCVLCAVVVCFTFWAQSQASMEGLPQGALGLRKAQSLLGRVVYDVALPNSEHRLWRLSDYVMSIWPILAVIGMGEVISLISLPFSTHRVRRSMQPLNDLALAAEELGHAATMDMDKISSLEHAIQTATVDSPHVSTGDKDLASIEVALNGLLRQMQEAKLQQMRFVSDASHELRTPISVIQGYVNMLDRWGKDDPEVLEESIAALKAESEHMQELVEQLLFLARGDSGRTTLQRERLNLAVIIGEVWEESRMIDEDHVYTLDVPGSDSHDVSFELEGDVALLKQTARILVQNARTYAAKGTQIAFAVRASGDEVCFSVQDEGIGMSSQDAARVFERFYRSEGARNTNSGGTGLGLSIAKWIVDAHDGRIEVLSREDVGTRFTVCLPRITRP